jgi:hypothetical protein
VELIEFMIILRYSIPPRNLALAYPASYRIYPGSTPHGRMLEESISLLAANWTFPSLELRFSAMKDTQ